LRLANVGARRMFMLVKSFSIDYDTPLCLNLQIEFCDYSGLVDKSEKVLLSLQDEAGVADGEWIKNGHPNWGNKAHVISTGHFMDGKSLDWSL